MQLIWRIVVLEYIYVYERYPMSMNDRLEDIILVSWRYLLVQASGKRIFKRIFMKPGLLKLKYYFLMHIKATIFSCYIFYVATYKLKLIYMLHIDAPAANMHQK